MLYVSKLVLFKLEMRNISSYRQILTSDNITVIILHGHPGKDISEPYFVCGILLWVAPKKKQVHCEVLDSK